MIQENKYYIYTYYQEQSIGDCPNKMGIYGIKNILTGKYYIGQSINIRVRILRHLNELRKGTDYCTVLLKAWKKYGEENFIVEILEFVDNENELDEREIFWIKEKESLSGSNGYNIFPGGNVLRGEYSPLRGKKMTDEQRAYQRSVAKRGPEHPRYGTKLSEEMKKRISEKEKGKIVSEETRLKLSIAQKGKIISEETRIKISESNKGRKTSEESKKKRMKTIIGRMNDGHNNKFPGISFEKRSGKWVAQMEIKENGKRRSIKIGRYKTDVEAFLAYYNKVIEIRGEHFKENFIEYIDIIEGNNYGTCN